MTEAKTPTLVERLLNALHSAYCDGSDDAPPPGADEPIIAEVSALESSRDRLLDAARSVVAKASGRSGGSVYLIPREAMTALRSALSTLESP